MSDNDVMRDGPPEKRKGPEVATTVKFRVDSYGWPVARIEGRWFVNFLRRLIHGKRTVRVRATAYLGERVGR